MLKFMRKIPGGLLLTDAYFRPREYFRPGFWDNSAGSQKHF